MTVDDDGARLQVPVEQAEVLAWLGGLSPDLVADGEGLRQLRIALAGRRLSMAYTLDGIARWRVMLEHPHFGPGWMAAGGLGLLHEFGVKHWTPPWVEVAGLLAQPMAADPGFAGVVLEFYRDTAGGWSRSTSQSRGVWGILVQRLVRVMDRELPVARLELADVSKPSGELALARLRGVWGEVMRTAGMVERLSDRDVSLLLEGQWCTRWPELTAARVAAAAPPDSWLWRWMLTQDVGVDRQVTDELVAWALGAVGPGDTVGQALVVLRDALAPVCGVKEPDGPGGALLMAGSRPRGSSGVAR